MSFRLPKPAVVSSEGVAVADAQFLRYLDIPHEMLPVRRALERKSARIVAHPDAVLIQSASAETSNGQDERQQRRA